MLIFKPDETHAFVADIDFAAQAKAGRHYYIIDIDNTITLNGASVIERDLIEFFAELKKKKFIHDICLVSNAGLRRKSKRVEHVAKLLGAHSVAALGQKMKPSSWSFRQAMILMRSKPEETVVIGDQLFTDIWGGNRLGLYTIWVSPLGSDGMIMRGKRVVERFVSRKWKN